MGWDSADHLKTRELALADALGSTAPYTVLEQAWGNQSTHWTVERHEPTGTTIIVCRIFEKSRGVFAYKTMTESEGPCYYSCPARFLDLAPVANASWRAKVRGG